MGEKEPLPCRVEGMDCQP
uniref:Uncharacterized protein n=1 Tax=Rhizophora mucronata TaxID=61149 RepID=A0A2P2NVG0_RHIMU